MNVIFLLVILLRISISFGLYNSVEDTEQDVSDLIQQYDSKSKSLSDIGRIEDTGGAVGSIDSAESIVNSWESDFKKERHRNRYKSTEEWNEIATDLASSNTKDMWNKKPKISTNYDFEPTSLFETNSLEPYSRRTTIGHLKEIAAVQYDIVAMLKRIEENSEKNTNCSTQNLEQQQNSIAEMELVLDDMKDSQTDEETLLSTRKKRELHTTDIHHQLELANKKRSRVIQLMEELNRFKDIQLTDMETENIGSAVSALRHKVCSEVAQEAKELADISKKLQRGVLEKRNRVMQLLTDLLLESPRNQEHKDHGSKTAKSSPQIIVEKADYNVNRKNNTEKSRAEAEDMLSAVLGSSRAASTKREGKVRVAGRVNEDRCERCEDLDEEEVCGGNGKTYRTLCHAVNCGGLALNDISVGPCISKNVCAHVRCPESEVCVPMDHATCLTLYSANGRKRLPCYRYTCMEESSNCGRNFTTVCGMDDKTYSSVCKLYKVGQQLAYQGSCRPLVCHGEVCGVDKNTYRSVCHAKARNVRVDYIGKCFSPIHNNPGPSTCALIRKRGRCYKEALCHKPVLPFESCCPICGGTVEIALKSDPLSNFILAHEEKNHLFEVVNLFRRLLPDYGLEKCELSGTLTRSSNISLTLEALNYGDHLLCQEALHTITAKTMKRKSLRKAGLDPAFEIAPFIDLDSWLRNKVVGIQGEIIDASEDFKHRVDSKVGETLHEIDSKVPPPTANGQTWRVATCYYLYILSIMISAALQ